MSITIEVVGLREVEARLAELGAVKIPRAMRRVVVAGAKPLRSAIRAASPVGKIARPTQSDTPGNLRRSVRYRAKRGSHGLTYVVGPMGKGSAPRQLVIEGHAIKGHGHSLAGMKLGTRLGHQAVGGAARTTPNDFVRRGRERATGVSFAAIEVAAREAIEAAGRL